MTDAHIDAIRSVYEEWGRGRWRWWPEVYGSEMEWEWSDEFIDIRGPTRDPEEATRRLRAFISQWEDWRAEPQRFIPAGDKVVALLRYSGTGKGSGMDISADGAHIWTMRDGKAVRLQIFSDPGRALEAAGLPGDL